MKARMLADSHDKKHSKGDIIEHREAPWLCGIKQVLLLPLGGDRTEVRELEAMQAEPADEECLKACIAMGFVTPDFVLKPMTPPAPVLETVLETVPEETLS